jgi:hypothetical protein
MMLLRAVAVVGSLGMRFGVVRVLERRGWDCMRRRVGYCCRGVASSPAVVGDGRRGAMLYGLPCWRWRMLRRTCLAGESAAGSVEVSLMFGNEAVFRWRTA